MSARRKAGITTVTEVSAVPLAAVSLDVCVLTRIRSFMLATRMGLSRGGPPNVEKLKRKAKVDDLVRALGYREPATDPTAP